MSVEAGTPSTICTERLELVPATPELLSAALEGKQALSTSLRALVPRTWPPEYVDPPALQFTRDRVAGEPSQAGWWMYFVLCPHEGGERVLIGTAGYKGPPTPDGTVEVGYSFVADHHRRGYASESVRALVRRAFGVPGVRKVIAETLPELEPSIGVLRKCGFELVGEGSEPGVIRFELTHSPA